MNLSENWSFSIGEHEWSDPKSVSMDSIDKENTAEKGGFFFFFFFPKWSVVVEDERRRVVGG